MVSQRLSCAFAPSLGACRLLTKAGARHVPADIAEINSINRTGLLKVEKKQRQNGNIEKN